jgi:pimeloyl-ACP methyl ester carboxylesterase
MGTDEEFLLLHRSFVDRQAGFSEEFHEVRLGLGRTIAVLSRPLVGPALPVGWVICHSFGMEQLHLSRLDVLIARSLSEVGFPVLRYHGQGYGDSELGMEGIGLGSHLAEAVEALDWMTKQDGVEQVGMIGARLGGAVALMVAVRRQLRYAVGWEPMVRGSQYVRDLLRSRGLAEVVGGKGGDVASEIERERQTLAEQGWIDIKGVPFSRAAHDEMAAIDLVKDLTKWGGSALVGGASRTGKVGPALAKLAEHLESIGAKADVEVITDRYASQFGQFRFQTIEGGTAKKDTQLGLNRAMAAATAAWSLRQVGKPAKEEVLT